MEFDVVPDRDGIVLVRHGLGTEAVRVACADADGSTVGYVAHVPIDRDHVEVVTVRGSGVTRVVVEPT